MADPKVFSNQYTYGPYTHPNVTKGVAEINLGPFTFAWDHNQSFAGKAEVGTSIGGWSGDYVKVDVDSGEIVATAPLGPISVGKNFGTGDWNWSANIGPLSMGKEYSKEITYDVISLGFGPLLGITAKIDEDGNTRSC